MQYNAIQYNQVLSKSLRGSTVPKHNNKEEKVLLSNTNNTTLRERFSRLQIDIYHLPSTIYLTIKSKICKISFYQGISKIHQMSNKLTNKTKEKNKRKEQKKTMSVHRTAQADQTGRPDQAGRPGRLLVCTLGTARYKEKGIVPRRIMACACTCEDRIVDGTGRQDKTR